MLVNLQPRQALLYAVLDRPWLCGSAVFHSQISIKCIKHETVSEVTVQETRSPPLWERETMVFQSGKQGRRRSGGRGQYRRNLRAIGRNPSWAQVSCSRKVVSRGATKCHVRGQLSARLSIVGRATVLYHPSVVLAGQVRRSMAQFAHCAAQAVGNCLIDRRYSRRTVSKLSALSL